ncbi:MAG TPA: STAS domain-containing protein [Methanospirillum sp.]|nr:STAS domain-containing protein [Methanospirillum sp.]
MEERGYESGGDVAFTLREEMGGCMPIDIWYDGDVFVFHPFGRVDAGYSVDLDENLTEGIGQGMRKIVLDLGDIPYISSSGLRALIKAAKSLKVLGGKMVFCNICPQVRDVLSMSGLLRIFSEYSTSTEAIAAFEQSKF